MCMQGGNWPAPADQYAARHQGAPCMQDMLSPGGRLSAHIGLVWAAPGAQSRGGDAAVQPAHALPAQHRLHCPQRGHAVQLQTSTHPAVRPPALLPPWQRAQPVRQGCTRAGNKHVQPRELVSMQHAVLLMPIPACCDMGWGHHPALHSVHAWCGGHSSDLLAGVGQCLHPSLDGVHRKHCGVLRDACHCTRHHWLQAAGEATFAQMRRYET